MASKREEKKEGRGRKGKGLKEGTEMCILMHQLHTKNVITVYYRHTLIKKI